MKRKITGRSFRSMVENWKIQNQPHTMFNSWQQAGETGKWNGERCEMTAGEEFSGDTQRTHYTSVVVTFGGDERRVCWLVSLGGGGLENDDGKSIVCTSVSRMYVCLWVCVCVCVNGCECVEWKVRQDESIWPKSQTDLCSAEWCIAWPVECVRSKLCSSPSIEMDGDFAGKFSLPAVKNFCLCTVHGAKIANNRYPFLGAPIFSPRILFVRRDFSACNSILWPETLCWQIWNVSFRDTPQNKVPPKNLHEHQVLWSFGGRKTNRQQRLLRAAAVGRKFCFRAKNHRKRRNNRHGHFPGQVRSVQLQNSSRNFIEGVRCT